MIEQFKEGKKRTFIVKPEGGCQGRGIFLIRTKEEVPLFENLIAQRYVLRPMLINQRKFDSRIYVLLTNVNPLRLYINKNGFIRICVGEY